MEDIKAPTLIVNGTQKSSTPIKYAKELAECIEN